ncbi:MAG: YueI family protein [Firmicutes bacterium]|nr:YueI family protein [Bacillota bacterium]HOB35332.1 YueI family protein [Bacillota bacterium]HPZ90167.1 YueI family protein [Bacillota bacterium]HQE01557.1 YueI family protein [Bacillota bacterium]
MRGNKFTEKSLLEQKVLTGLHGAPQLKREERQRYLGQFRERVIKVLTVEQINEPGIYEEIRAAMAHPKARKLLISSRADLAEAAEYIRLARQHNLSFTVVNLPEYKGPIGLVVAADEAVDVEDIAVPDRTERLLAAGVPLEVIHSRGQPLCRECMELLRRADPAEVKNYRKLTFLDRLLGHRCPCFKSKS